MNALLLCIVVGISDGDTLRARCGDAPAITVRLAQIDAPEKRQAFGERSRQHLAELCFQKQAEIAPSVRDRYGRTVARVKCDDVDANAEQVRAGLAWAYTKYLTDPSVKALEMEARETRRGLWTETKPVPPWEWRHPPNKGSRAAAG